MSDLWFEFNGTSSEDYGVVVKSLPMQITWPRRVQKVTVPGRDGTLHLTDGALEEIMIQIQIYLPYEQEGANTTHIGNLKNWLRGSGRLRISTNENFEYDATIVDGWIWNAWVEGYGDILATIPVIIKPYEYFRSYQHVDNLLDRGFYPYMASAPANPILTIIGTGNVTIYLSGMEFRLEGLDGSRVVVDCEERSVYINGEYGKQYINDQYYGEFPVLQPGFNYVQAQGSVTSIAMDVQWRNY